MMHLAKRVFRQTWNDKRSVMMILFAPLLILTLVYFLLGNSDYVPTVGVDPTSIPTKIVDALEEQELKMKDLSSEDVENPKTYLEEHQEVDAIFNYSLDLGMEITMFESSTKGGKAANEIQEAMSSLNPAAKVTTSFVFGDQEQSTFDSLGFVFLALFSFFLVFIISGMALVRERSGGTLERLLMSPIKRGEVILGYTLGYGIFAIIQSIFIVLYSVYILDLPSAGNIGLVMLTMVLLAITAVSFGATISIFSNSELQVVQMIPFTIIPQVFFSGLIPLDLIPYNLGNLCYLMPIYYGASAIKGVMVYGHGIGDIWIYLLALLGYALVLYMVNTQALRKFRRL
ncbi:ABC transporter permease [Mangrovibacillus cuniculi]|uniref:ABC transporter permease n=1 Tax=Mangrovibacillus cuniculi TaxID=2593652 RepID=A0A7S8C900_9BACI|nr:ABC transporter permease [Mangrovibacillus cuniculi]QPC45615.1 ABC transporter permease [Mangrovibacillus cuniculi]